VKENLEIITISCKPVVACSVTSLFFSLQFDALVKSHAQKEELVTLIQQKEIVGDLFNQLRLALQRRTNSRPAQVLE
jgi:hypothetical protein